MRKEVKEMVSLEFTIMVSLVFALAISLLTIRHLQHGDTGKPIIEREDEPFATAVFTYVWPSRPWYGLPRKVNKHP